MRGLEREQVLVVDSQHGLSTSTVNSDPTSKESENLKLKVLKKQSIDDSATPSLREGA